MTKKKTEPTLEERVTAIEAGLKAHGFDFVGQTDESEDEAEAQPEGEQPDPKAEAPAAEQPKA